MRSQHKKCRVSERIDAVAQRGKRPSVKVAAWISRRIHASRDKTDVGFLAFADAASFRNRGSATVVMRRTSPNRSFMDVDLALAETLLSPTLFPIIRKWTKADLSDVSADGTV